MLVGSFYALPAFQKQFGVKLANGSYQLTAPIQTAFSEQLKQRRNRDKSDLE